MYLAALAEARVPEQLGLAMDDPDPDSEFDHDGYLEPPLHVGGLMLRSDGLIWLKDEYPWEKKKRVRPDVERIRLSWEPAVDWLWTHPGIEVSPQQLWT